MACESLLFFGGLKEKRTANGSFIVMNDANEEAGCTYSRVKERLKRLQLSCRVVLSPGRDKRVILRLKAIFISLSVRLCVCPSLLSLLRHEHSHAPSCQERGRQEERSCLARPTES